MNAAPTRRPMHAGVIEPKDVFTPTWEWLLSLETFRPQLLRRYEQDHRLPNARLAERMALRHATLSYQQVYDSISPGAMPNNGSPVCVYQDGAYAATAAQVARFSGPVAWITVFANPAMGIMDDCEQGNAGPSTQPGWATARRAAGLDPTTYCGQNQWWSAIIAAFEAAGVAQDNYLVANYSYNSAALPPPGAIGVQWSDRGGGGSFDISNVINPWPGVQVVTPPDPPPPPANHVVGGNMGLGGWQYRPGTGAAGSGGDTAYIQPGGSNNVLHAWGSGGYGQDQENIGGWCDPRAGVSHSWDPTGNFYSVSGVGSDGMFWINTWGNWSGKWGWSGWSHLGVGSANSPMTPLLPAAATPGAPGAPGTPGTPGAPGVGWTGQQAADAAAAATALAKLAADVQAVLTPAGGSVPRLRDDAMTRENVTLSGPLHPEITEPTEASASATPTFVPGTAPNCPTPPGMGPK